MRATRMKLAGLIVTLLAVAGFVAGCGGISGGGSGSGELSGAEFTVGSKDFTEQLILGNITKLRLEDAGASVQDQIGLSGSNAIRQALLNDEVDMYWEYTGTGWINFLGNTEPVEGRQEQFEAVAERDLEQNDIEWLAPPAPANNTFALVVRNEVYEDLGVQNLSDMGQLIDERPDEATLCADSEFASRDDALPGLEEEYGFEFPNENVSRIAPGAIPEAIDNGDPCNFGVMQTTDGRIQALDLKVLEDDENFFPLYNPALTVSKEKLEENPELKEVITPVAEKLTTENLREMNAAVDVDGEDPEDVAEEWLTEEGFIG